MNRKLISVLICAVLLASCGAQTAGVTETAAGAKSSSLSDKNTVSAAETVPLIKESFSSGSTDVLDRGAAHTKIADDSAASDGKSLQIYDREEAWNGAQWDCECFRGNEIEVSGSFRSSNPSVRVTIQFTIYGNTSYNMIFAVNTNETTYTKGKGKYTIPANAEQILVYIESDNLNDIYADDLEIKVVGNYKYHEAAEGIVFADTSDYPSLKQLYKDDFLIGTAISPTLVETPEYSKLVKAQFNSVTLENNMKPQGLLDRSKTLSDVKKYKESPAVNFDGIKSELDFAKANGMKVRGHTLIWHSQTPDWIFYKDYDTSGELADRKLMLKRMENYIKSVMEWTSKNYPGLIYAWDVVNEGIDDGGGVRKSLWYKTIGDDYIARAFEYARKYAPSDTKLFYNDYNSYVTSKQTDILNTLRPIKEAGNIDGIGMQSHISTDTSLPLYFVALKRYSKELGLEIQITELDIGHKNEANWQELQGDYYEDFFTRLKKAKANGIPITSVTLWGISDGMSWRTSELPLLFNADLSKKPAFEGVVAASDT